MCPAWPRFFFRQISRTSRTHGPSATKPDPDTRNRHDTLLRPVRSHTATPAHTHPGLDTFFLRLYTPLSNLGPAQLESRASHECAEALPVRDPAGPTPTHRHGPTISHKAATSLSSTPSPHPQPSLTFPSPVDPTPAAFTSCGGAPPALGRERISSIVPLVVAVTVDVRRPEAAVQVCMRSRPQASDV